MSSGRTSRSEPLKARPMGVRTASMITASGISDSWSRGRETAPFPTVDSRKARLLGRHAKGAVQPDGLPVQHRILSDVTREGGELGRLPEPRRERDLLA